MKAGLVRVLLSALAALPFAAASAAGGAIGRLQWWLPSRTRAQARANIDACYPDRAAAWRERLTRSSLRQMGRTLSESAWLWHHPHGRVLDLVHEFHGLEHFERARRAGKGIIFATPHIGLWELILAFAANHTSLTVLYRRPRIAALERILLQARERYGAKLVPTDASGVRALYRALNAGEAIGLLPDQQPRSGQGVTAPFMGQPAPTMTLLSRMAARTGATVLFVAMLRRDDGPGFVFHLWPAEPAIASADTAVAARQVNRETERAIAFAPEQYMWSYQRFRKRGKRKSAAAEDNAVAAQ